MSWTEANAATQLLAEEKIGTHARRAEAAEEARYQRSKAALRRDEVKHGPR